MKTITIKRTQIEKQLSAISRFAKKLDESGAHKDLKAALCVDAATSKISIVTHKLTRPAQIKVMLEAKLTNIRDDLRMLISVAALNNILKKLTRSERIQFELDEDNRMLACYAARETKPDLFNAQWQIERLSAVVEYELRFESIGEFVDYEFIEDEPQRTFRVDRADAKRLKKLCELFDAAVEPSAASFLLQGDERKCDLQGGVPRGLSVDTSLFQAIGDIQTQVTACLYRDQMKAIEFIANLSFEEITISLKTDSVELRGGGIIAKLPRNESFSVPMPSDRLDLAHIDWLSISSQDANHILETCNVSDSKAEDIVKLSLIERELLSVRVETDYALAEGKFGLISGNIKATWKDVGVNRLLLSKAIEFVKSRNLSVDIAVSDDNVLLRNRTENTVVSISIHKEERQER